MEIFNKQRINCEVESCKHHDCNCNECVLSQINITKSKNNNVEKKDTICDDFEKNKDEN